MKNTPAITAILSTILLVILPLAAASGNVNIGPGDTLYKAESNGEVKIDFAIYPETSVIYNPGERFNSITRITNVGTQDIVIDSNTYTEVTFYNFTGSKIDWGYKKVNTYGSTLTIQKDGWLTIETRPNASHSNPDYNYKVCHRKTPSSVTLCIVGYTHENVIPESMYGLYYMDSTVEYKIGGVKKSIALTTDNFQVTGTPVAPPQTPDPNPEVTLQDFLDAIEISVLVKNNTVTFDIKGDLDESIFDVSDFGAITLDGTTIPELVESITLEAGFTNDNGKINYYADYFKVEGSTEADLLDFLLEEMGYHERVADFESDPSRINKHLTTQFDTTCPSGTFSLKNSNIRINFDCGLNQLTTVEQFKTDAEALLEKVKPDMLNNFILDVAKLSYQIDFELEVNWNGFTFNEGSYQIFVNYEDNKGNVGSKAIDVQVSYDSTPAPITPPPSGGGGGVIVLPPEIYVEELRGVDMPPVNLDNRPSIIILREGGVSGIIVKGRTHQIKVDRVTSSTATITVSSTPQTFALGVGETKYLDLEQDGQDDLMVRLFSISGRQVELDVRAVEPEPEAAPREAPAAPQPVARIPPDVPALAEREPPIVTGAFAGFVGSTPGIAVVVTLLALLIVALTVALVNTGRRRF